MFKPVMIRCAVLAVLFGVLSADAAVRLSVKADIEKEGTRSGNSESETQIYEVDVQLANTAKSEESALVEWYFITRPLNEKGKKEPPRIVYGGEKEFTVAAGKRTTHAIKSRPIKNGWTIVKKKGKVYTGSKFETYLIVVKQDGKIVQQKAGYAKYLKPEWMGQLKRARGGR